MQNIKRISSVLGVVSAVLIWSSCGWFTSEVNGAAPSLMMVNVLDKNLYNDCHIAGSIQIDFDKLEDYALRHWDKEATEIVLYCSNYLCSASGEGTRQLQELGFKKVYAFEGGMAEWYQRSYPVEGPCTQKYLTMENEPSGEPLETYVISINDLKKKIDEQAAKGA